MHLDLEKKVSLGKQKHGLCLEKSGPISGDQISPSHTPLPLLILNLTRLDLAMAIFHLSLC